MLDPYHCSLRTLSLLADSGMQQMAWERLRLLDFLIAFPHTLKSMRVPAEFRAKKATLNTVCEPYESLPNPTRVFYQVAEIQSAAMRLLVAGELIDRDSLENGIICLIDSTTNQKKALASAMQLLHYRTEDWYEFIVECLSSYPLDGRGGLKERTGLMEYRHDYA